MPPSAPQERPILDIQHATVYRGERQIFSDLSLKVDRRVHSVILGSNGVGKSTLLKLFSIDVPCRQILNTPSTSRLAFPIM